MKILIMGFVTFLSSWIMHLQVNVFFDLNVIVNYFEQLCIDEIKCFVHFFSKGAFNCNENSFQIF